MASKIIDSNTGEVYSELDNGLKNMPIEELPEHINYEYTAQYALHNIISQLDEKESKRLLLKVLGLL